MKPPNTPDRASRVPVLAVVAAGSITVLDGFDAFSLSLMAPRISADLDIATASLGTMFACAMVGMILGAVAGSALADKVGRLGTLIAALALFGTASLAMPWMIDAAQIGINRLIAGIGLGTAAPIAIGLLNRSSAKPPSSLLVSLVWAGLPLGGCLAAVFNYLFAGSTDWRAIFVVGGVLPLPAAVLAWRVFRAQRAALPTAVSGPITRPRVSDLFHRGQASGTLALAGTFFFGYVTTSIIAFWLPTILSHRSASTLLISLTFGAFNVGGVIGIVALGLITARVDARRMLPVAWLAAGACGLASAAEGLGNGGLAALAVLAYTIAGGANAISVAVANGIYRERGIETAAVGLMTGMGRLGQASALGASGAVISLFGQETSLFGMAGLCACLAALLGMLLTRIVPLRRSGMSDLRTSKIAALGQDFKGIKNAE